MIEPVCVVDNRQKRPLLGRLGQQAEDRQTHQERIGWKAGAEPKRHGERFLLGHGQSVHEAEERETQLLNRRERQLHLRFDASRPDDPELAPSLDRVLEERGLADPGLAVHDQHAAPAG